MQRFINKLNRYHLQALFAFALFLGASTAEAANQADWERSAYHIRLHIAVEASDSADLAERLAERLEQHANAAMQPLWSLEVVASKGPLRHQLLTRLGELSAEEQLAAAAISGESSLPLDKQMFLTVTSTAGGFVVSCRELDHTTQIFGPIHSRTVYQRRMLTEHCIQLLCDTFAPLAKIRRIDDDSDHITLHFKGAEISSSIDPSLLVVPGNIYRPMRIRMTRTGEIRPGGISTIPWTYLEFESTEENFSRCRVYSAIQHPFGVRRRGRVEHLAIAMRQLPAKTRVRFYAQHDKSQSLTGYEVFRREPDSKESQLVGLTDNRGSVEIVPERAEVTTLYLRSGDELLAKVPVVPGSQESLEIPIADDIGRLNAQATLTSLREQLIDLVARRNILIARTRDRIENSSYDEANELLSELDELPGRAQYAQFIASAQNNRRNRSDEPRIQDRIDKMFANTRKLLGRFLDTRPVSNLKDQLNAARSGNEQS